MLSGAAALDWIVELSGNIPGWRAGRAAKALATTVYNLEPDPAIVEVGVFMGRSTFLMAGARRLRGGGKIHCVDPFDCSGDPPSVPHYQAALKSFRRQSFLEMIRRPSLEEVFRRQMEHFRCEGMVDIRKGTSRDVSAAWRTPIDLLILDGDQSPEGAREAFESWTPFVRRGGIVVLGNTEERAFAPLHDGNYRMARERLSQPHFVNVHRVECTTFATVAQPLELSLRSSLSAGA